jgi:bifunctional DNA-binding transcriptional regulator/antitoxin component of YhaV-PrlF toxin-antitoxin module
MERKILPFSLAVEGDQERCSPLLPERFSLEVRAEGRIPLPPIVRESLGLEPGVLLSLTRNAISVRLDPYDDLLEDLQRSVKEPKGWRYLEQFLRRTLTSVGPDGSVALPPGFLALRSGDLISLEVATEGLRHSLYIYRIYG